MPWREAARRRLRKTAERVTEEVESVLDEFAPEKLQEVRLDPLTIDVREAVPDKDPSTQG